MGAYLSQPNTSKTSSDGGNSSMGYGFSAMQGWRVSMEDAHNCIPDFDEETAMFAVYDGHGGEEVALYCSKYLPDIIKEQKTYKDGKLQKALEDAFLAIDSRITTEEVIKELVQIAGRPTEEPPAEKVAEEDDLDTEEAALLHEEATMTIEELLVRYGQNRNAVKHAISAAAKKASSSNPEASEDKGEGEEGQKKEGVNGEVEEETNGKVKEGEGVASSSKLRACRRTGGEASSAAADVGESESANGEEKPGKAEGDAGPSCSSLSSKASGDSKSRFFDDSEESEEGEEEEEEGSDEEDGSEEEEGDSSELDEEEDTEEGEEDSEEEEEEEMCLPGMDGKEEPGSDSGTTAVVALIRGKQLIVANAGDSRCVVSERGKAVDMSYDHKPEDEVELARIKNAGGKVTMDGRVNGGLNLSRAIGDHFYKRNKALPQKSR
ncbi:hypothetical protein Q5P01_006839 [Channa striata]|uniref:protein-serine/threonine phosphatase n=1 Tax=Channa striata TaxID=64152 RepID=A0AA88SZ64_CHASR|nr:hypothetical protein Q5P01_006839 [Channa striata]